MVDKLELRVPDAVQWSQEFSHLYREVRGDPDNDPFREGKHYVAVGDLREFGHEAMVHLFCRHGDQAKGARHKLELLDTGTKSYSRMMFEVCQLFDCDPEKLEVMRVDLAADVPGVPVSWFAQRTIARTNYVTTSGQRRTKYYNWLAAIGDHEPEEISTMGRRGLQTVYWGRRPNCFRAYDKVEEWYAQYRRMLRGVSSDCEPPTFEQWLVDEGLPVVSRDGARLTRVERQMAAGKVPPQLSTPARLRANGVEFDPFDRLEFLATGRVAPNPSNYSVRDYCAGMYLRQMCDDLGVSEARSFVSRYARGHGREVWEGLRDFLPADDGAPGVSSARLRELYQQSVSRQLAN